MTISGVICLIYGFLLLVFSLPTLIGTERTTRFLMNVTAKDDGRWRLTSTVFFVLGLGMIISAWSREGLAGTFVFWAGWCVAGFTVWGILIPFFGREWMESQMDDFNSWKVRLLGMTYAFWGFVFVCLGLYMTGDTG